MRYLVITADSSEDQIFFDHVLARSKDEALAKVVAVRGPGTDGHLVADAGNPAAFTVAGLRDLIKRLERKTTKQIQDDWKEIKDSYGGEG